MAVQRAPAGLGHSVRNILVPFREVDAAAKTLDMLSFSGVGCHRWLECGFAIRLGSTPRRVVKMADSCADGVKSESGPQGGERGYPSAGFGNRKKAVGLEELRK
jgi:hypothetical protein